MEDWSFQMHLGWYCMDVARTLDGYLLNAWRYQHEHVGDNRMVVLPKYQHCRPTETRVMAVRRCASVSCTITNGRVWFSSCNSRTPCSIGMKSEMVEDALGYLWNKKQLRYWYRKKSRLGSIGIRIENTRLVWYRLGLDVQIMVSPYSTYVWCGEHSRRKGNGETANL